MARDKANLDITWLRDESLEDVGSLPAPEMIAREIVEDLSAVLAEFEAVAAALEGQTLPKATMGATETFLLAYVTNVSRQCRHSAIGWRCHVKAVALAGGGHPRWFHPEKL